MSYTTPKLAKTTLVGALEKCDYDGSIMYCS